jgi:hypothetical protein
MVEHFGVAWNYNESIFEVEMCVHEGAWSKQE